MQTHHFSNDSDLSLILEAFLVDSGYGLDSDSHIYSLQKRKTVHSESSGNHLK